MSAANSRAPGPLNPPDILVGTNDISTWQQARPNIGNAPWLTQGLIGAGLVPEDFRDARVAPVVVGLATTKKDRRSPGTDILKTAVDTDYLRQRPGAGRGNSEATFNPHYDLRDSVRSYFKQQKAGDTHLFPGYVFPDIAGGSVYLDDRLSDSDCTPESLAPTASVLTQAYGLGYLVVGRDVLVDNEYGHLPTVSITSVVRTALRADKSNRIDFSPKSFQAARREVGKQM